MHLTDKERLLSELAQNAKALAVELRNEHDRVPLNAEQRAALIDKLRRRIREDYTALGLDAEGGAA
jgi:hypothetical protein